MSISKVSIHYQPPKATLEMQSADGEQTVFTEELPTLLGPTSISQIFPQLLGVVEGVLFPDGNLMLTEGQGIDLELTAQAVSIDRNVQLNNLTIDTLVFHNQADIKVSKTFQLNAKQRVTNSGKISVEHELVIGTSPFRSKHTEHKTTVTQIYNKGEIIASNILLKSDEYKKAEQGDSYIVNSESGKIVARKSLKCFAGTIHNEGKINAQGSLIWQLGIDSDAASSRNVMKNYLYNNGTISAKRTRITARHGIVNHQHGVMEGSQEMVLILTSKDRESIINQGKIKSKKISVYCQGTFSRQHGFSNLGEVQFDDDCRISTSQFYNAGNIASVNPLSHCMIEFRSKEEAINAASGKIIANNVQLQSTGSDSERGRISHLHNFGEIRASGRVHNRTSGDIVHHEGARILAKKMHLFALQNISNSAEMAAKRKVSMESLGRIKNHPQGNISSQRIQLAAETAKNQGTMHAARHLDATADHMKQSATGKMLSDDSLRTAGKTFQNEGQIVAQGPIQSKHHQFNNERQGVIYSADTVSIQAAELHNAGNITALNVLLRAILKFSDLPEAKLQANRAIELISHGNVNITGRIGSSETERLMVACHELLTQEGALLFADKSVALIVDGNVDTSGTVSTHGQLHIKQVKQFVQRLTGKLYGQDISFEADTIKNSGAIVAEHQLALQCHQQLKQTIDGLIEAGHALISSYALKNQGKIQSNQELQMQIESWLKNYKEGEIISDGNMKIQVEHIFENFGELFSNKALFIRAKFALKNMLEAQMLANENFVLESDFKFENHGTVASGQQLHIQVAQIIENFRQGKISAEQSMRLISKRMENQGDIRTEQALSADLQSILINHQEGTIQARKSLQLMAARLVINQGTLNSANRNVTVQSQGIIENSVGGTISANQKIELYAQDIINREAEIIAKSSILRATQYLCNTGNAHIIGSKSVQLASQKTTNSGLIQGKKIKSNTDLFINNGQIIANKKLDVTARQLFINLRAGKLKADEILDVFTENNLENYGKLLSGKNLSLIAKKLIHSKTNGSMMATEQGGQLYLRAIDLFLEGHLQAGADLLILVENQFEYNALELKADGLLQITLKNGRTIQQSINTPGALEIELVGADGTNLDLKAALSAGKNLRLTAPGKVRLNATGKLVVHQAGENFAVKGAEITQHKTGVVAGSSATYVATEGSVERTQGFTLSKKGTTIDAKIDSRVDDFVDRSNGGLLEKAGRDIKKITAETIIEEDIHFEAQGSFENGPSALTVGKNVSGTAGQKIKIGPIDNNIPDTAYAAYSDPFNTEQYMTRGGLASQSYETVRRQVGSLSSSEQMDLKAKEIAITGQVVAEKDAMLTAEKITVARRQHTTQQWVTDHWKKKSWGGLKKKNKKHTYLATITISQAEAKIISEAGKVVLNANQVNSRAGIISGAKGTIARVETDVTLSANIDTRIEHAKSKSGNFFSSSYSSTHHARHTIKPTNVLSREGVVDLSVGNRLFAESTFFFGDQGVKLQAESINLIARKIQEDMIPIHQSRGLINSVTTGTYEHAKPVIIMSPHGEVNLSARKNLSGDAPQISAKGNITLTSQGTIDIKAIKLKQVVHTKSEGINGLNYVKINDRETHETIITPLFYSENGNITVHAAGDVRLEAPKIETPNGDFIGISDAGLFALEDVVLEHTKHQHMTSIAIRGLASNALSAILKKDFGTAAKVILSNLLPPIEAINELYHSKDTADVSANSIKTLHSLYNLMTGLANAQNIGDYFTESLLNQLATVGITVSHSEMKASWETVQQTWILARRIILMGHDIKLNGIQANAEEITLKAKNSIQLEGSTVQSTFKQSTTRVGLSSNLRSKQPNVNISVNYSEAERKSKQLLSSLFRTRQFIAIAGEEISLKQVIVETRHAYMDAKRFKIESMQDESHSHNVGAGIGISISPAGVGLSHLSAQGGMSDEQWNQTQAGIHARQSLYANIRERTELIGAKITLGDDATPVMVGDVPMYQYPMPNDGDALFHAMGISRSDAANSLLAHIDDTVVRQQLSLDLNGMLEPKPGTNSGLNAQALAYGYDCDDVPGEGNCFYYAVTLQLNRILNLGLNPTQLKQLSKNLRALACDYLENHLDDFNGFVDVEQIAAQRQNQVWVEDAWITALGRALNLNIALVRSDGAEPTIKRLPNPLETIYLGYIVGSHYQSLVPRTTENDRVAQNRLTNQIENTEISNLNFQPTITSIAQLKNSMLALAVPTTMPSVAECEEFIINQFFEQNFMPRVTVFNHQAFSSLNALAKIKGFNYEIWQQDEAGMMQLKYAFRETQGAITIRMQELPDGKFNLLHEHPGLLISPVLTYHDLEDSRDSVQTGFSFSQAQEGVTIDINYQQKDQAQSTRSTVNPSISIQTQSDISRLNRDLAKAKIMIRDNETHVRVYVPFISPSEIRDSYQKFKEKYSPSDSTDSAEDGSLAIIEDEATETQLTIVNNQVERLRREGKSDEQITNELNPYLLNLLSLDVNESIVEAHYAENKEPVPHWAYEQLLAGMTPKIVDGKLTFDLPQVFQLEVYNGQLVCSINIGKNTLLNHLHHQLDKDAVASNDYTVFTRFDRITDSLSALSEENNAEPQVGPHGNLKGRKTRLTTKPGPRNTTRLANFKNGQYTSVRKEAARLYNPRFHKSFESSVNYNIASTNTATVAIPLTEMLFEEISDKFGISVQPNFVDTNNQGYILAECDPKTLRLKIKGQYGRECFLQLAQAKLNIGDNLSLEGAINGPQGSAMANGELTTGNGFGAIGSVKLQALGISATGKASSENFCALGYCVKADVSGTAAVGVGAELGGGVAALKNGTIKFFVKVGGFLGAGASGQTNVEVSRDTEFSEKREYFLKEIFKSDDPKVLAVREIDRTLDNMKPESISDFMKKMALEETKEDILEQIYKDADSIATRQSHFGFKPSN